MALYDDLIELGLSLGRGKRVKRAVLGLYYAFSELERGGGGLAFVDKDLINSCCGASEITFWKQPADILVKYYHTSVGPDAFISLSVINALINNRKDLFKSAHSNDPLSVIPLTKEDNVLMIGYFEPLYKKLEGKVQSIIVLEKEQGLQRHLFPSLGKTKLAIVTSATLSNKTLHTYFPLLKDIPEVVLMGPTTPLSPEIFKYTPIKWLSGVVVKDSEELFKLVCEGKGTPAFFKKGVIEKINLRIKD